MTTQRVQQITAVVMRGDAATVSTDDLAAFVPAARTIAAERTATGLAVSAGYWVEYADTAAVELTRRGE